MYWIQIAESMLEVKTDSVPYKLYRATFLLHADENSNDLLSHLKGQQGHLLTIGEGKAF